MTKPRDATPFQRAADTYTINVVASWMVMNGYAVDKGDTVEDLLAELVKQARGDRS
jgi:hypothetical protein